ncbi:MAG: DUF3592 domain-containing protein [Thermodesulfobacteriota bacterium]
MVDTAFAILAILVGSATVLVTLARSLGSNPREHWIPVPGRVVRSSTMWSGEGYQPDIAYRYVIDGIEYESSSVSPGISETSFRSLARKRAARYPEGADVIVYVNPASPSDALLETQIPQIGLLAFFVGGLLMVAVGVVQLAGW